MEIDSKYNIGQTVYVKHDIDQLPRIVTSLVIMPRKLVQYNLSSGDGEESSHYDFELSDEENISMKR